VHTRVVLVAGAMDPVDDQEVHRVRADGVLKKPFESSVVLETVKPLLLAAAAAREVAPNPGSLKEIVPARIPSGGADPELIRAAVTIALDASLPGLIEEITQKVLVALKAE
jgi:hypothetical protein